jgi:hypothetical protein
MAVIMPGGHTRLIKSWLKEKNQNGVCWQSGVFLELIYLLLVAPSVGKMLL